MKLLEKPPVDLNEIMEDIEDEEWFQAWKQAMEYFNELLMEYVNEKNEDKDK